MIGYDKEMTREEFEKRLQDCCNAAAGSWRKDTMHVYNETKAEIIAEFDRLTAEVERIRWHYYPDRGGLPDFKKLLIWQADNYYFGYFHPGAGFVETNKSFHPSQVIRWRYIE